MKLIMHMCCVSANTFLWVSQLCWLGAIILPVLQKLMCALVVSCSRGPQPIILTLGGALDRY